MLWKLKCYAEFILSIILKDVSIFLGIESKDKEAWMNSTG